MGFTSFTCVSHGNLHVFHMGSHGFHMRITCNPMGFTWVSHRKVPWVSHGNICVFHMGIYHGFHMEIYMYFTCDLLGFTWDSHVIPWVSHGFHIGKYHGFHMGIYLCFTCDLMCLTCGHMGLTWVSHGINMEIHMKMFQKHTFPMCKAHFSMCKAHASHVIFTWFHTWNFTCAESHVYVATCDHMCFCTCEINVVFL